jgi:hypothetical protein
VWVVIVGDERVGRCRMYLRPVILNEVCEEIGECVVDSAT